MSAKRNETEQQPQGATPAAGQEQARPRRPYARPEVHSSEVFERAASGCGFPLAEEPCNGVS